MLDGRAGGIKVYPSYNIDTFRALTDVKFILIEDPPPNRGGRFFSNRSCRKIVVTFPNLDKILKTHWIRTLLIITYAIILLLCTTLTLASNSPLHTNVHKLPLELHPKLPVYHPKLPPT